MKRNQQLLADLQRIDSQFNQLEVKLERLSNLKVLNLLYLFTIILMFDSSLNCDLIWAQVQLSGLI
jgi:hypothetical protein